MLQISQFLEFLSIHEIIFNSCDSGAPQIGHTLNNPSSGIISDCSSAAMYKNHTYRNQGTQYNFYIPCTAPTSEIDVKLHIDFKCRRRLGEKLNNNLLKKQENIHTR